MNGRRQDGFTILEAAVSLSVLAVALLSLWGTVVYCSRSNVVAEQKKRAVNAAQAKIEEMRSHPFATLLADYAPGGTPGDVFTVAGLDDSIAGAEGRVTFTVDESRALGTDGEPLPLDLNGDGDATDPDVSGEYLLLPVRVTIQWKGPLGIQRVDLRTLLRKED
jgi:Tfp pilus assembly protein PilV